MPAELRPSQALRLWEDVVFALVRDGEQDLTFRQMAILLTVLSINLFGEALTEALSRRRS